MLELGINATIPQLTEMEESRNWIDSINACVGYRVMLIYPPNELHDAWVIVDLHANTCTGAHPSFAAALNELAQRVFCDITGLEPKKVETRGLLRGIYS